MAQAAGRKSGARRMTRDARMADILRVARDVLRERGFEQFTPAEVAVRCRTSEGTIYKYFPTRRELLNQVAEAWFDELLSQDYPGGTGGAIEERLYQVIWWSLSFIRREPMLSRYVLLDLRADPEYRTTRAYAQNREVVRRVMTVIADGQSNGTFRKDLDTKLVRNMIFGAIEHQTWAFLRGEADFSVDDSAAGITRIILSGVLAKHPAGQPMDDTISRLERVADRLEARLHEDG